MFLNLVDTGSRRQVTKYSKSEGEILGYVDKSTTTHFIFTLPEHSMQSLNPKLTIYAITNLIYICIHFDLFSGIDIVNVNILSLSQSLPITQTVKSLIV